LNLKPKFSNFSLALSPSVAEHKREYVAVASTVEEIMPYILWPVSANSHLCRDLSYNKGLTGGLPASIGSLIKLQNL